MKEDGLRLVGDDADLVTLEFGTELVGDAVKTFDVFAGGTAGAGKKLYQITGKASTASIFGDLVNGDIFPADGDEIMAVGDKAKPITQTPFADCSSFVLNLTAAEIETTVIRDRTKKYRKGKADADGSIKCVFTIGETSKPGGILNQFMKIVKKTATTVTVSEQNSKPIYILGYVRQTDVADTTQAFVFAQIELFGVKLGADSGSKQEFESKIRLTGIDPVYWEVDVA